MAFKPHLTNHIYPSKSNSKKPKIHQAISRSSTIALALALALTLLLGLESLPTTTARARARGSSGGGVSISLNPFDAIPWPETTEVKITNRLESRVPFEVYCKDKSDVGMQQVGYDSTYAITFTESILAMFLKNTVYSCEFKWSNVLHKFDFVEQRRDSPACGTQCDWEVKEKGPCLVHPNKFYSWTLAN